MEKNRDSGTLKILEKFEQMIQENKSFYLDLNELEESLFIIFMKQIMIWLKRQLILQMKFFQNQ